MDVRISFLTGDTRAECGVCESGHGSQTWKQLAGRPPSLPGKVTQIEIDPPLIGLVRWPAQRRTSRARRIAGSVVGNNLAMLNSCEG